MTWGRRSDTPSERDLAAFADGSLPAAQRGQIEQALSGSPQLRAAVAAQHRVLEAIDAAARERAPSSLRARVRLVEPPRRRRRPSLTFLLSSSAVGACAAAVVAVVLSAAGGTVAPTVAQAALLTGRAPQASVGEPVADHGTLPRVHAAGLTYPYWEDQFGYRAMGVRYDQLSGRRVTTVFYQRGTGQVAYEIVSGSPLRMGANARTTTRQGVRMWAMSTRRGLIVAWLRDGHTCILIGAGPACPCCSGWPPGTTAAGCRTELWPKARGRGPQPASPRRPAGALAGARHRPRTRCRLLQLHRLDGQELLQPVPPQLAAVAGLL